MAQVGLRSPLRKRVVVFQASRDQWRQSHHQAESGE